MKSHCYAHPGITVKYIRELVLRQMPFGVISDLPGKKWMLHSAYYAEPHHGIRKLNVTETQLAAELIYSLNENRLNSYVSQCINWLDEHRDSQNLFPIWVPGAYVSPYSYIRNAERRSNLRCTAQRDYGSLLIKRFEENIFEESFRKILALQSERTGAWAEDVNGQPTENVFATANATLLVFTVWKDSLLNSNYGKRLRSRFGDIIHPIRYSWSNGSRWFYEKITTNGMLKGEILPLFSTASIYLTLYPLLKHHDKELPLELRTLDRIVDYFLKNNEGVWRDKPRRGDLDLATTIRVLALITQHLGIESLKYHVVRKGFDYIFKNINLEELRTTDLIYWTRTLINVNGKAKVQDVIFTRYDDTFLRKRCFNSTESSKAYSYYEEWLLHSRNRQRMLQAGVENQIPAYSKILKEEKHYAKQVTEALIM